jgi:hypothetical protein
MSQITCGEAENLFTNFIDIRRFSFKSFTNAIYLLVAARLTYLIYFAQEVKYSPNTKPTESRPSKLK